MPSVWKAVMQMNEKQRKAAIIVASILGCGALFYLGGLLGQVFTNYTIWMESGGMWGQTQIAAPDWNPVVCFLNAFSWNGVKAILLIAAIGASIVIYVKVHEKFSQNQYDDRGFTKSKAGTYGTADWMTEKELKSVLELSTPEKAPRLAPSPSLLSSKRRRRFLLLKTRPILFGTCPAPLTRQRSTCTVLSPVR